MSDYFQISIDLVDVCNYIIDAQEKENAKNTREGIWTIQLVENTDCVWVLT